METVLYMAIGIFLLIASVYFAAFVTYYICLSDMFETNQKAMIICIAWLIPILGPGFIYTVIKDELKLLSKKRGIPLLSYIFLASVFKPQNTDSAHDLDSASKIDSSGNGESD